MSYIYESFYVKKPRAAVFAVMDCLNCTQKEAQRYIDKGWVEFAQIDSIESGLNCDFVKLDSIESESFTQDLIWQKLQWRDKNRPLCGALRILVFKAQSRALAPIYENEDFALFNKPAGLLIHPKGAFCHYSLSDEVRAFCGSCASVAHRIDKETSGLVLVGKNRAALGELNALFEKELVKKEYLALVRGDFSAAFARGLGLNLSLARQEKGGDLAIRSICDLDSIKLDSMQNDIESKISTDSNNSKLDSIESNFGANLNNSKCAKSLKFQSARTDFYPLGLFSLDSSLCVDLIESDCKKAASQNRVEIEFNFSQNSQKAEIESSGIFTLILARPHTGRTHQIRAHLNALGFPILGDPIYGSKDEFAREYLEAPVPLSKEQRIAYFGASRMFLHASKISFTFRGKFYSFSTPLETAVMPCFPLR